MAAARSKDEQACSNNSVMGQAGLVGRQCVFMHMECCTCTELFCECSMIKSNRSLWGLLILFPACCSVHDDSISASEECF